MTRFQAMTICESVRRPSGFVRPPCGRSRVGCLGGRYVKPNFTTAPFHRRPLQQQHRSSPSFYTTSICSTSLPPPLCHPRIIPVPPFLPAPNTSTPGFAAVSCLTDRPHLSASPLPRPSVPSPAFLAAVSLSLHNLPRGATDPPERARALPAGARRSPREAGRAARQRRPR